MEFPFSRDFQELIESLVGKSPELFLSFAEKHPFATFRFNPLKHTIPYQKDLLRVQGFRFTELENLPLVARVTASERLSSIGRSFSHFTGHLYIQDLGSMLPVVVLDPKPGERVLDLCAAPGSKTTQMAAAMKNRGVIVANDISVQRLRSLIFNLRRMGVKNTSVCKGFGEQYGNLYFEAFDRVLVDPPCSALGTLHKSPEVLSWWSPRKSEKLAGIQLRLIASGLKALRPGGVLTYSTCTITPIENEQVIDQALRHYPVELEEIKLTGLQTRPALTNYQGRPYRSELSKAIRIYPWDNQSEGFFLARLRKVASFGGKNLKRSRSDQHLHLTDAIESIEPHLETLANRYGFPDSTFNCDYYSLQRDLCCSSPELREFPLSPLFVKAGLPVAHVRNSAATITTEGTQLLGCYASRQTVQMPDLEAVERYLNREPLPSPLPDTHQAIVRHCGMGIGHAASLKGQLLSRFPRTSWRFEFPAR